MKYYILFTILLISAFADAQDPVFSQIQNARSYSNPSSVDFSKLFQLSVVHRRQWTSIPDNGYVSSFADFSYQFPGVSAGVSYLRDVEGTGKLTTQTVRGKGVFRIKNYGFKKLNQKREYFSLSAGGWFDYITKFIDYSDLVFSDQLNLETGIAPSSYEYDTQKKNTFNVGVGATLKWLGRYNNAGGQPRAYHIISLAATHLGGTEAALASQSNSGVKLPSLVVFDYSPTLITYEGKKNDKLLNPYFNIAIQGLYFDFPKVAKVTTYKTTYGFLKGIANNKDENRGKVSSYYWGISVSNQLNPFDKRNINAAIGTIGFEKSINDWLLTAGLSYDYNYGAFNGVETFPVVEVTFIISKGTASTDLTSNIFNRSGQVCPPHSGQRNNLTF